MTLSTPIFPSKRRASLSFPHGVAPDLSPSQLVWFTILMVRRKHSKIGAELGGPQPYKALSSAVFAFMWFLFVTLFSLTAYGIIEPGF